MSNNETILDKLKSASNKPATSYLFATLGAVAATVGILKDILFSNGNSQSSTSLEALKFDILLDHIILLLVLFFFVAFAWLSMRQLYARINKLEKDVKFKATTKHFHLALHNLRNAHHKIEATHANLMAYIDENGIQKREISPQKAAEFKKRFAEKTQSYKDLLQKVLDEIVQLYAVSCGHKVCACIKVIDASDIMSVRIGTLVRDSQSADERHKFDTTMKGSENLNLLDLADHFQALYETGQPWVLNFGSFADLAKRYPQTAARQEAQKAGLKIESALYGSIAVKIFVFDREGSAEEKVLVPAILSVDSPELDVFNEAHADILSAFCDILYKPIEAYLNYANDVEELISKPQKSS